jgi:hypothetical protein
MFAFRPFHRLSGNVQSTGRPRLRRRPPARSLRPRLEDLETYQLMSTFTVVLATDNGGPNGQEVSATTGDLRYCIEQADASHSATSDTIDFSSSVFGNGQTITLDRKTGTLVLDDSNPLSINGPGDDVVSVSGGNAVGVFDITGGQVNISNLVISNGEEPGGGGGIQNAGVLKLTDCMVDQDQSADSGGGLLNSGTATIDGGTFDDDSAGLGGGIFNDATLTVTNVVFNNDSATNGGAIGNHPGATATVSNSGINDNSAGEDGGGLFVEGTVTLDNCNISSDSALAGGGVCTDGGTANLKGCTVSNDSGVTASGQNRGAGAVTNSGGQVNLNDCQVFDNADEGLNNGGIANVSDCTFSNDSTVGSGGAIGSGPASTITAILNVSGSTFRYDSAGVNGGAVQTGGSASFTNCSFADNYAAGGGGALWNQAGFSLNVDNCTIADNSAGSTGGGIWNQGALNLWNTIVAEDTVGKSWSDVDNAGTVNAEHDLIGNGTDSGITKSQGSNLVGKGKTELNPLLGPLKDNGGQTPTMALSRQSRAIGHADDALAPLTDQRGEPRTDHFGLHTDIGAYEYESTSGKKQGK